MPKKSLLRRVAPLAALAVAATASADAIVLKDGTTYDGRVVKEDAQSIWIKVVPDDVVKVSTGDVKSRTAGESDLDRYERLKAAVEGQTPTVDALWDYYVFCKKHAKEGLDKECRKLLPRILKMDPNHAGARDENGEAPWNGDWVKKTEIPRLEAEKEKLALKNEWQTRLKVPLEVAQTDHWLLLDNTGEKDLGARAKQLDKAYDTVCETLGITNVWQDKVPVVTVKKYDDFCRILDDFANGIPKDYVAFAKDKEAGGIWRHKPVRFILRWPTKGSEGMWSAVVHNAAHVMIWSQWPVPREPPAWLDEGMGAFTEIEVMGQQMSSCVGRTGKRPGEPPPSGTSDKWKKKDKNPKGQAKSLRDADNEFKQKFLEALDNNDFPSLRQFLNFKLGDFGPAEEGAALGLVTWLSKKDGEKFHALFKLLVAGNKKTLDEYFRETFGFDVVEDMETKFEGWAKGEW